LKFDIKNSRFLFTLQWTLFIDFGFFLTINFFTMKKISLLTFLLFGLLSCQNVFANHASGGNIRYTHITGNQYLIHATFYRDCVGDPGPSTLTIHIASAQCSIADSVVLTPAGFPVTYSLCPNIPSTCIGGTQRGINAWDYEGMYSFPTQCGDWVLSTIISGRPSAITTIQHPASTDLYLEARLNNSTGDNSSPQFINPVFDILAGQQTVLNFGFIDMDGDSLSYSLISARESSNTNVSYIPTYSGTEPFTSIPPVSIDAVTGDIVFNAMSVESSVLVCQVNEFRNGDLMGSEMLDLNINTNFYSNSPSVLYGWDLWQTAFYAGPGMMCLNFFSDDPDVDDTLTMLGNVASMPGATFIVAGDYHPTGTLCWNVDSSDVRPQPYTFSVRLDDNACPGPGVQIWSFVLFVTLDTTLINTGVPSFSSAEENNFVVPNPFNQQAEIILSKSFANVETEFQLYDAMGNLIEDKNVNAASIQISGEKLQKGIYFFELSNGSGKISTGKFILE